MFNKITMLFSIIIPTRGNDLSVLKAINSIKNQSYKNFEIIIIVDSFKSVGVNDWIDTNDTPEKIIISNLCQSICGHGPSFSRNIGVLHSRGDYICFLDDDDFWVDPNYLCKINDAILYSDTPIDVFFSNQNAIDFDHTVKENLWINRLKNITKEKNLRNGFLPVCISDLTKVSGFCHVNTTILRKQLFEKIGGFDESIKYEEDLDFYFRIIDNANNIYYYPHVTSNHIVPLSKKNASKTIGEIDKYLYSIKVLEKNLILSNSILLENRIKHRICHLNKKISLLFFENKSYFKALYFISKIRFLKFDIKIVFYVVYLKIIIIYETVMKRN